MRQPALFNEYDYDDPPPLIARLRQYMRQTHAPQGSPSRQFIITAFMALALVAFEVFNFDTTRYALGNLIGDAGFGSLKWALVLAIALWAIDFGGLLRLFTPDEVRQESKEMWYLMGAWVLAASMNAIMTWWAVSVTLLNNSFGNEVLGRETLLRIVPVFVAVLVWLTRVLFIGALSVTGEKLVRAHWQRRGAGNRNRPPDGYAAATMRERRPDAWPFGTPPASPAPAEAAPAAEPVAPPRPPVAAPVRPAPAAERAAPAAQPAARNPLTGGGTGQGVRRPMPGQSFNARNRR